MTFALLISGAAIVLVMVGIAQYGWRVLPASALVPMHWRPASWSNWVPKRTALLMYPGIGIAVFLILTVTLTEYSVAAPIALIVLASVEHAAIRAALRESGRGDA
jgi:hypothetical protein